MEYAVLVRGRSASRVRKWGQWAVLATLLGCAGTPTVTHRRSGATTTLEGLRGKVVVVNFWAEWCKPCLKEIPEIARALDAIGPEVLFLPVYYQVDRGSPHFSEWIEAQPAYFRERICFATGTFLASYSLSVLPKTYVYGRDGRLLKEYSGAILDEEVDDLRATVRSALAR